MLRPADDPFAADGGLRMLDGPLGTGGHQDLGGQARAPGGDGAGRVFDDQADFLAAFEAGELDGRDFVAVIRYQGPAANGMPELHKLTPALGVLQDRGQRVAIVTDGRMSGASGKVPAAIHLTPEAAVGGPLARVRDGDLVTLDADAGVLDLDGVAPVRARRRRAPLPGEEWAGTGRELFAAFRAAVGPADKGASVFPSHGAPQQEVPVVQPV